MTDEPHTDKRTTTELPQAKVDQSGEWGLLTEQSPSAHVVVFAYWYLCGTTLERVITTNVITNRIVKIGGLFLALDLLRIVEPQWIDKQRAVFVRG